MNRISLNAGWQFVKLPKGIPVERENLDWETVSLPHTWYREDDPYHGLVLYRREIGVGKEWKKAFLEFEGADQVCQVYVNGVFLGEHRGGYSRFRFEIPQELLAGGALQIEAALTNSANSEVSPNFGDFTVFGGLYRGVNLLLTGDEHFDYLYYGTDGVLARTALDENGRGVISIEPHVCVSSPDARIRYTLLAPDGGIAVQQISDSTDTLKLFVDSPELWNGNRRVAFYQLHSELISGGQVVDESSCRLGFRRIAIRPDEGLRLNGERLRLRGVAKHQDWGAFYNAVTAEQIDQDFALIREIGANALRLSHYQHAQHTYDRCDEEGLLTWAEIPMLKMTENAALLENAKEQLRELILQNLHHPSIFCWGIQNEIGMFRDAEFMHKACRELTALAKELDPTRLVTGANLYNVKFSSPLNQITDMIGYNLYFGWYYGEMPDYSRYLDKFHAERPEMPIGISEYGVDANPHLHAEEPKCKDYSEEFQALWHETVYPILQSKDYLWGSFVWNMFDFSSDRRNEGGVTGFNTKGLVSADRGLRKDAFYYYKAVWSDEPFVHLCASRFVRRARERIDVKIYTNLPRVTLWKDGERIGIGENNGNGTVLFRDVALAPGINRLWAVSGDCEDRCLFERVEKPEESYRLPEESGGAVRNWFLSDDDTVKEGYYSIMDTAEDVLSGARSVLVRFVPSLVEVLDRDVIPLGLSMKSILSRELKNDPDTMLRINDALHQIKKEL